MIAHLSGTLLEVESDGVIVDCHGVGYRVAVSRHTALHLGAVGAAVALRIHTHVREDALSLFGFGSRTEEELFHRFTAVSGVGPKLAMAILSGLPEVELVAALAGKDLVRLTKIPGVGKKTAERLVLELSDKMQELQLLLRGGSTTAAGTTTAAKPTRSPAPDELVSALVNMGYRPAEAEKAAVAARDESPGADLVALVRRALQLAGAGRVATLSQP